MSVRVGAVIPSTGRMPLDPGVVVMAKRLERAGFDSVWVSDHIVLPKRISSRFPFSHDGKAPWDPGTPWYDTVVMLSAISTATQRMELGTAVLLLALRNPLVAAKQLASIDSLSRGRLTLGVGAGWLAEEFEALGAPFEMRGERLEEWIAILRSAWSGTIGPFDGQHCHHIPSEYFCRPIPEREPPLLIGGMSETAVRRAGRLGDGWIGQQAARELDPDQIRWATLHMREAAAEVGRADGDSLRVVLRVHPSAEHLEEVAARLPALERAGVNDIVVDIDWRDQDEPERAATLLLARLVGR